MSPLQITKFPAFHELATVILLEYCSENTVQSGHDFVEPVNPPVSSKGDTVEEDVERVCRIIADIKLDTPFGVFDSFCQMFRHRIIAHG